MVGFEEFKELAHGFGIRPYYSGNQERRRIFQECINLDSHPRTLTMEHINYLSKIEFDNELCRISRVVLDDPTCYVDIDLSHRDGYILTAAATVGDLDLFTRLLHVPNMNTPDSRNRSIYNAAGGGHLDIVQFLIPSMTSESGNNAMSAASRNGHLLVVQALLDDTRVDPSALDNRALRSASENGHLLVVQALLDDTRVDPSALDNRAFQSAAGNGHLVVVHALLQDARVYPSAYNNWALINAATNGHITIVQALLRDGRVDPTANNNSLLRSSASIALRLPSAKHYEICSLLLTDTRVLAHYRSYPFYIPAQVILPPLGSESD